MLVALIGLSANAAPWWDPAWGGRIRLDFDNAAGPDLDDFVVGVFLDGSRIDLSRTDGNDLRFVDADGSTVLSHEVERWDEANGIELWVRVPRIDAGSTSDHIWLYYDRAGASSVASGPSVWASSYRAVWHLANTTDSTGVVDASAQNGAAPDDAAIGRGYRFDGNNDYLSVPTESRFDGFSQMTVDAWVRWEGWASGSDWHAVIAKGDETWRMARYGNSSLLGFSINRSGGTSNLSFGQDVTDGAWHHYTFVATGSEGVMYVDGVETGRGGANTPYNNNNDAVNIGRNGDFSQRYWRGWIDEVRVDSVARGPEWVAAQHRSQSDTLISWCNPDIPALADADGDLVPCDEDCDDGDAGVGSDTWFLDADGDGYGDAASMLVTCAPPTNAVQDDTDCDDTDPQVSPATAETCDGIDENCNGVPDDGLPTIDQWPDGDLDGWGAPGAPVQDCALISGNVMNDADCDDSDASVGEPVPLFADADGDGYGDAALGPSLQCPGPGWVVLGGDCDDADADRSPATPHYADADGDGFGAPATAVLACVDPPGTVLDATDCDDGSAEVNPAATEVCGGVDDDCDGLVDDADPSVDPSGGGTFWADGDADGFGSGVPIQACSQPAGHASVDGDCAPADATAYPGAPEQCDAVDDDCDGQIDEDTVVSDWFRDADGDGFGDSGDTLMQCEPPPGYVLLAGDCDDGAAAVNPAAAEVCNGLDDDCDTQVDVGAMDAVFGAPDADGDGYGNVLLGDGYCGGLPSGYVADASDCDDTTAAVSPVLPETCDGLDNDCDGLVDYGAIDPTTFFEDADGDGYGDPSSPVLACDAVAGVVADGTDCDDGDATVSPGALELCDGVDQDCDGLVDDDVVTQTWYVDADGDGYGAPGTGEEDCIGGSGEVTNDGDCDDTDAAVSPAATELPGNSVDEDCDGVVDPGGQDATADTAGDTDTDVNPIDARRRRTGCSCDSTGSLGGWGIFALGALALARRGR